MGDMEMKRWTCGAAVIAAGILVVTSAGAQEVEVSGNVMITSDYAFRGISQTLEKPAVQGGLDITGPLNLYVGAWGSSVNFGEDLSGGSRAQMELDVYFGIAPTVAGVDLDVGLLYYAYPGAASVRSYNFLEAYAGVARSFGDLSFGLNGAYSPDFFAASGTGVFGSASVSALIPGAPLAVEASVGRQAIEDNAAFGTPDYTVWSAGVSADYFGASFGATVTGTDLKEADCFGGSDLCKTRVIVSVSRAL
jgi:uncharacterized protein (TIGR02001 family)